MNTRYARHRACIYLVTEICNVSASTWFHAYIGQMPVTENENTLKFIPTVKMILMTIQYDMALTVDSTQHKQVHVDL